MEKGFCGATPSERIANRLQWIHAVGSDTIGGAFHLELTSSDEAAGCYTFLAKTEDWMRNVIGTFHGGSAAALCDQAMGCVANCLFSDEPHAPTSQLQLNFHRPLFAGDDMTVTVQVTNVSRSMIHLSAQAAAAKAPGKLCVSATAVFFRGQKQRRKPNG